MSQTPPVLLLDGHEVLETAPPGPQLLESDPFEDAAGPDPFLERLDELNGRPPLAARAADELRASPDAAPPPPRASAPKRLAELEPAPARGLLERLFGEEDLRRVAWLERLVPEGGAYDRFGLSPRAVRAALPFFLALHRLWFRAESRGVEHLPAEGPAVLAANHAGLLPFDGAMAVVDVLLRTDPPRLLRAVVDRWAGDLPWVGVFLARVGQVVGTRENMADLLAARELVLVFPEGMDGIRKTIAQRYRLQRFRVGFIEQALRARAPVIPTAIVGSDDQAPVLYDVKPLARLLGLPLAPITPTFPWLGPLGLLPYPVRYRIVYGEPLAFHERFGPEGAEDARLVRHLANLVRRNVQQLLDRHRG